MAEREYKRDNHGRFAHLGDSKHVEGVEDAHLRSTHALLHDNEIIGGPAATPDNSDLFGHESIDNEYKAKVTKKALLERHEHLLKRGHLPHPEGERSRRKDTPFYTGHGLSKDDIEDLDEVRFVRDKVVGAYKDAEAAHKKHSNATWWTGNSSSESFNEGSRLNQKKANARIAVERLAAIEQHLRHMASLDERFDEPASGLGGAGSSIQHSRTGKTGKIKTPTRSSDREYKSIYSETRPLHRGKVFSMLVEKEVISPGQYWYTDEATGAPRKLDVTPELTRYWNEQGSAMLASGLTVPVPYEHDFTAHPMTPKEKLLNNAGEVKEYKLKGDVLWSVVDVQDPDVKSKIGKSIRWTSPWINSFTDGDGKKWNNVISHLALTTRPRITKQEPFVSIAAALSMAEPLKTFPKEGYCLSKAGLLTSDEQPAYPIAFSILSGAALATKDKSGHTHDEAGKFSGEACDASCVTLGIHDDASSKNGHPKVPGGRREDMDKHLQTLKSGSTASNEEKKHAHEQMAEHHTQIAKHPNTSKPMAGSHTMAARTHRNAIKYYEGKGVVSRVADSAKGAVSAVQQGASKVAEGAKGLLSKVRNRVGLSLEEVVFEKATSLGIAAPVALEVALSVKDQPDYELARDQVFGKATSLGVDNYIALDIAMAVPSAVKKPPVAKKPESEGGEPDANPTPGEKKEVENDNENENDDVPGDLNKDGTADSNDAAALMDQGGDIAMEELLCDLLQALGVPMPDESNEAEFKRHLYEAVMSKIKELTSQGMADKEKSKMPDQNKPPGANPNTSHPNKAQPNPLIQQEQQPMYMSLEEINQLPDPMKGVALAMYNENAKLRAEIESSKKVTNSLRDSKLKEVTAQRAARVALLGKLSPRVKADLDAMMALPEMALSMGDGGVVVDPMTQTLAVLEKGLADIPQLLTTDVTAADMQPHPSDGQMEQEVIDKVSDDFARMMGCPPEPKHARAS